MRSWTGLERHSCNSESPCFVSCVCVRVRCLLTCSSCGGSVVNSVYLHVLTYICRPTTLVQAIHRTTIASPKAAADHIRLLQRSYGSTHTHKHTHTQQRPTCSHTHTHTYTHTHTHTHTHKDTASHVILVVFNIQRCSLTWRAPLPRACHLRSGCTVK